VAHIEQVARPLCILTPEIGVLSETFIQWDIDGLLPGGTIVAADPPVHGASVVKGKEWVTDAPSLEFAPLPDDPPPPAERIREFHSFIEHHGVQTILIEYLDFAERWLDALWPVKSHVWVRGHGVDLSAHLRRSADHARYNWLNSLAGIMVPSRAARARLLALGVDPALVHFTPNHVTYPSPASRLVTSGPLRCLAVGRLVEKKGHQHTLRAFDAAARHSPGMSLSIVGEGSLHRTLRDQAAALTSGDQVSFLGAQPPARVSQLIAASDVLLHHSVTAADGDAEGMPLAVLEAMAAGVCVVATRHEGITDLIDTARNGLLVDEGDWQAMGAALSALDTNRQLLHVLAQHGRTTVRAGFSHAVWRPQKLAMLGLPHQYSERKKP
jgi:colanic acid/amylovoran biosynthesis glycosyltransferase